MKIYNTRCFGTDEYSGNEAVIIENSSLTIEERLSFAKSLGKSASVFIEPTNDNTSLILDYYYPHKRSPLCLHGTLAATHIHMLNHKEIQELTIITSMTNQKINAKKVNGSVFLTVVPQAVEYVPMNDDLIYKFLNIGMEINIKEYYIASSGSPKLFIELFNLQDLYALVPNLELINEWGSLNKVNGLYVYCQLSESNYSGRNFNHSNPVLEDAATGVAVAAMTAYLQKDLAVYQGIVTKNECVIYTKFLDEEIQISGRVTLY